MKRAMPLLRSTAWIGVAAALLAPAAEAHALLEQAVPAVGGAVPASPAVLRLRFDEGIEPRFSTVTLAAEAGGPVPLGRPVADPADPSVLVVAVGRRLPPGDDAVTWHVVSVDTHKTQASFHFTITP